MDEKYIIDTDIGDDVDDAFAVMLAAKSKLDVIGITTVFRNSVQRAKMAKYFLRLIGREDIPIVAGIDKPFLQKMQYLLPAEMLEKEEREGYYTLPQYMPEMDGEEITNENAVDFIIKMAEKHGENLVLVPIGPLTNIAMAIRKAPDIMRKIKQIRIIGGNYSIAHPEWNIACDPEAAKIVFTSGIPLKAIGIDITMRCPLSDEQLDKLKNLGSESASLICNMIEKWMAHYNYTRPVMHDPLVLASFLEEGVVEFEKKIVSVALSEYRGCTIVRGAMDLETAEMDVAVNVYPEKFFKVFDEIIFN